MKEKRKTDFKAKRQSALDVILKEKRPIRGEKRDRKRKEKMK